MPRFLGLAVLLVLLASAAAHAAVFIVPPDDEMIDTSEVILIGKIRSMNGQFVAWNGDIVTNLSIDVESVLKGSIDTNLPLHVRELGGTVGSQTMTISDAASYWNGNRALIFLERDADGYFRTYGFSLGKFDFVTDSLGRNLAVRWLGQNDVAAYTPESHPHEEKMRSEAEFIEYIRLRAATARRRRPVALAQPGYFVDPPPKAIQPADIDPAHFGEAGEGGSHSTGFPPSAYTNGNYRWPRFDEGQAASFFVSGTQPGYDSTGAAQRALSAWTSDAGSNIRYTYGGTTTKGFVRDGTNSIVFNSSSDVPSGALGYAAAWSSGDHKYGTETFFSLVEGDVVIRSGITISQKVLDEAVTHELGHTLGFRHSDAGTPSSSFAVMTASLSGAFGASLAQWEIDAAHTVYKEGTTSTPVLPPTGPANTVARRSAINQITVTWTPVSGATSYQIQRSSRLPTWTTIGTSTTPTFVDTTPSPGSAYLYRVIAANAGGSSSAGAIDWATTFVFTNDPLTAGTIIRAVHVTEVRAAVNELRWAAGLSRVSWTDPNLLGVHVKAVHINEIRTALNAAYTALGRPAPRYTIPTLAPGTPVRAIDVQELRNFVQ